MERSRLAKSYLCQSFETCPVAFGFILRRAQSEIYAIDPSQFARGSPSPIITGAPPPLVRFPSPFCTLHGRKTASNVAKENRSRGDAAVPYGDFRVRGGSSATLERQIEINFTQITSNVSIHSTLIEPECFIAVYVARAWPINFYGRCRFRRRRGRGEWKLWEGYNKLKWIYSWE